jgi:hypothetical protein
MEHPNIARVFDPEANREGRPYFVMEYVDGIPIADYCDRHRLTIKERLELFMQVFERSAARIPAGDHPSRGRCNCNIFTVVDAAHPEQFEAMMNLECPEHGFCGLRGIALIHHIGRQGDQETQLSRLLLEYRAGQRAVRTAARNLEFEYDAEEY